MIWLERWLLPDRPLAFAVVAAPVGVPVVDRTAGCLVGARQVLASWLSGRLALVLALALDRVLPVVLARFELALTVRSFQPSPRVLAPCEKLFAIPLLSVIRRRELSRAKALR
jgi:hypothetical protein